MLSLASSSLAHADVWAGRPFTSSTNSYSYFDNKRLYTVTYYGCVRGLVNASVLPEIYGGDAIPGYVNNVDALVGFLQANNGANDSGASCNIGKWQKGGAAFIAQTMLGRTGDQANANGGRSISSADWNELRQRLNGASINWNQGGVSTDGINTEAMYNPATRSVDVNHFRQTKVDTAIVITSRDGSQYKIYRHCANPIGSTSGIAPAPQDFTLTPSITANQTTAEPSSPVTISPTVKNKGSAASRNTQWQLSQFIVPSGGSYPGAGNSGSAPAPYYGNGLTRVNGGTGASFPAGGPTAVGTAALILPDAPAGSRVCYALSVQARSDQDGQWAHSLPVCIVIAKKPKMQVQGSDLSVGRVFSGVNTPAVPSTIDTSTSVKIIGGSAQTFGSWIEYGIFATGSVKGAASGSAFAGSGMTNATVCNYSTLTFTNSGSSTCSASTVIGNYQTMQSIPDVAASFPVNSSTNSFGANPTIDINVLKPQGVYTATGNVSITGGGVGKVVAKGQWFVLNAPNADVTIVGDINYTGEVLHGVKDIPQVVIIAKNITIADTVTHVDAWLITKGGAAAGGVLNTCAWVGAINPLTDPLTVSMCDQPLVINGPVMAQKLFLRRTAGSGAGPASGDPAETINLRPDAYLWSYERAISNGRVQTVYSQELPPRF